jgi:hypothetical protein
MGMSQKPELITRHNIMEFDMLLAFDELESSSRKFDSFVPKPVGQCVRKATESGVLKANLFG